MLARDQLDNMIATLTTIMDSHECPEYRAVRYCARIAQVSSKEAKYCYFRLVGQVLSPNGKDQKARNMSADLKKALVYSQQGLKTRNRVHPRSLPRSSSHQICLFAWITEKCCAVINDHIWLLISSQLMMTINEMFFLSARDALDGIRR